MVLIWESNVFIYNFQVFTYFRQQELRNVDDGMRFHKIHSFPETRVILFN